MNPINFHDMKTIFSKQNYRSAIIRDVLFLILGLVLIIFQGSIINKIIQLIGAFLLALAVVGAIKVYKTGKESPTFAYATTGVVFGAVIGIIMFFIPDVLVKFSAVIIGIILVYGAVSELVSMIRSVKYIHIEFINYLFPVVNLAMGIALMFATETFINSFIWLIGLVIIIFGVADFIIHNKMHKKFSNIDVVTFGLEDAEDIEDVEEAEEVK